MTTREKRASALGFALSALVILPVADGTIGQADKQQVTFSYSGILAADLNLIDPTADVVVVVQGKANTIVVQDVPDPVTSDKPTTVIAQ